jgi:hypothetical protein
MRRFFNGVALLDQVMTSKTVPLVVAVAFGVFLPPCGAADAVPSESVARQEFTKLVEDQVGEVVAFKVTGRHPITVDGKDQYEVHFESTVRYPTGLYLMCKDPTVPRCDKLGYVEPGGLKHGTGKIVLEKTKDGWQRPEWPY